MVELFRQPVVRNGDVARRAGAEPRLAPFPVVELIVVPARPTTDGPVESTWDAFLRSVEKRRFWCRRAKFSNSRAARERTIEDTEVRSVARKVSITREIEEKA